jgi:hypothetical protein
VSGRIAVRRDPIDALVSTAIRCHDKCAEWPALIVDVANRQLDGLSEVSFFVLGRIHVEAPESFAAQAEAVEGIRKIGRLLAGRTESRLPVRGLVVQGARR